MRRRLALIVATYEYDDPGLRQLTAPLQDATELAAVLGDEKIGGFEVTSLINKPHNVVGATIGEFYDNARPDDLTLLYFTGHGLKDDNGRLYLAMKDTRLNNKRWTSVTAELINESVADSASREKVLILDCCYAGAFPSGTHTKSDDTVHVLETLRGRGRVVLTASDATQYAFEDDSLKSGGGAPQSIFTRHLIAGIREGTADRDNDGDITVDDLYYYVDQKVTEERPGQRPKMDGTVSGRTVIAQNIHWSIPEDIRRTLGGSLPEFKPPALDILGQMFSCSRNQRVRRTIRQAVEVLRDTEDSRKVEKAASDWLDKHPIDLGGVRPIDTRAAVVAPAATPDQKPPPSEPGRPAEPPQPPPDTPRRRSVATAPPAAPSRPWLDPTHDVARPAAPPSTPHRSARTAGPGWDRSWSAVDSHRAAPAPPTCPQTPGDSNGPDRTGPRLNPATPEGIPTPTRGLPSAAFVRPPERLDNVAPLRPGAPAESTGLVRPTTVPDAAPAGRRRPWYRHPATLAITAASVLFLLSVIVTLWDEGGGPIEDVTTTTAVAPPPPPAPAPVAPTATWTPPKKSPTHTTTTTTTSDPPGPSTPTTPPQPSTTTTAPLPTTTGASLGDVNGAPSAGVATRRTTYAHPALTWNA